MSVRSQAGAAPWSRAAQLPADLQKLRGRYLETFPGEEARIDRIAHVPAAFRHLLSLRLELYRADALPRRYRDIADAVAASAALPGAVTALDDDGREPAELAAGDRVDRLVAAYAAAFGTPHAATLRHDLLRYFTGSQLVEMALVITLARALAVFDAMDGGA